MSDRELLEKAAKAAGYTDAKWQDTESWSVYGFREAIWSKKMHRERGSGYWNPLADDGDALRLAVKLQISINADGNEPWCELFFDEQNPIFGPGQPIGNDPYAATRRAIVRAAAALAEKPTKG